MCVPCKPFTVVMSAKHHTQTDLSACLRLVNTRVDICFNWMLFCIGMRCQWLPGELLRLNLFINTIAAGNANGISMAFPLTIFWPLNLLLLFFLTSMVTLFRLWLLWNLLIWNFNCINYFVEFLSLYFDGTKQDLVRHFFNLKIYWTTSCIDIFKIEFHNATIHTNLNLLFRRIGINGNLRNINQSRISNICLITPIIASRYITPQLDLIIDSILIRKTVHGSLSQMIC